MAARTRRRAVVPTLVALVLINLGGGCAATGSRSRPPHAPSTVVPAVPTPSGSAGPASTAPVPMSPTGEVSPMLHVRTIGSDDNGQDVVLRFGDRLDVVPATRPHGWVVADFTREILQLQGTADAATSHTFVAIAVGTGHITLTAAGTDPGSTSTFTVAIHVLRDTVQTARP